MLPKWIKDLAGTLAEDECVSRTLLYNIQSCMLRSYLFSKPNYFHFFFLLQALLPAVYTPEQLPSEPDAAGRPAVPTVQGGVLEERKVSLESSLLSTLPLHRTPLGPTAVQQGCSEQLQWPGKDSMVLKVGTSPP